MHSPSINDEALYRVLKDYAMHEDSLMNTRMNWCMVITSFMLAGLAGLANAVDKLPIIKILAWQTSALLPLTAWTAAVGIVLVTMSWTGVRAAERSMRRLNLHWKTLRETGKYDPNLILPELLGGISVTSEKVELQEFRARRLERQPWLAQEPGAEDHELSAVGRRDASVAAFYPKIILSGLLASWVLILAAALLAMVFPEVIAFPSR